MVYEFRLNVDFAFGTLSANAAMSDTTLSSAAFAGLPGGASVVTTSIYIPIVLMNPATGAKEVVYITGHSASATTVTVVRGMEGYSAQPWPAGTTWAVAPTVRDGGVLTVTSSTTPANPHVGMTIAESDSWAMKRYTRMAGWQAAVGAGLSTHFTRTFTNGAIPPSATIQFRGGPLFSITPDGSGVIAITYPQPFPNGVISGWGWSQDAIKFFGFPVLENLSTTGGFIRLLNFNGNPFTTPGPDIGYLVIGY